GRACEPEVPVLGAPPQPKKRAYPHAASTDKALNETANIYSGRHRWNDWRCAARRVESRSQRQRYSARSAAGRILFHFRYRMRGGDCVRLLPLAAALAEKIIS